MSGTIKRGSPESGSGRYLTLRKGRALPGTMVVGRTPFHFSTAVRVGKAGLSRRASPRALIALALGGALHLDAMGLGIGRRFYLIGAGIGIDDALLLVGFGLLLLDDGLHARASTAASYCCEKEMSSICTLSITTGPRIAPRMAL